MDEKIEIKVDEVQRLVYVNGKMYSLRELLRYSNELDHEIFKHQDVRKLLNNYFK
jgi:hypothetical protein